MLAKRMHGRKEENYFRQSDQRENFNVDCRTPKSDNENVDAPIHKVDERFFEKVGKPELCFGFVLRLLQLLPFTQKFE